MSRESSGVIANVILKLAITGATITLAAVMPNALIALQKPLKKTLDKLDKDAQAREVKRVMYYLKSQGLLDGSYQHGLKITPEGRKRLTKLDFDNLAIDAPRKWDGLWRIVFYDIPEKQSTARRSLTSKLQSLGFYQLQKSVLVHPFDARKAVEKVATIYDVSNYITYIEALYIDNQKILIEQFSKQNSKTEF